VALFPYLTKWNTVIRGKGKEYMSGQKMNFSVSLTLMYRYEPGAFAVS